MSAWQPITGPVGSATAIGTYNAAGPTITYSSTAGNTLVACGFTVQGGSGGSSLSATNQLASIIDTAGNVWQFSTSNSQFPPSVFNITSPGFITWVAWCINAAAITSVTFTDGFGGSADVWNVSLTEWAGIAAPDSGIGATSGSAVAYTVGTVRVSTPGDVVVGVMNSNAGTLVSTPSGTTALPGETGLTASSLVYGNAPFIPASPFLYIGSGSNGTSGGSTIGSIVMPPDVVAGDLLILDVVAYNATVSTWPSGFTQQLSVTGATSALNQRFVATKLATGTETILSLTMSGTTNASALLYVLRGAASAIPANTATATASGYTTSLANASLTIAAPTDATLYGYGGVTAARGAYIAGAAPAALSNGVYSFLGEGTVAVIGWGIDVVPGSNGSATAAVDTLDWAMDIPVLPLGVGGNVTWNWQTSGGALSAVAMMSFSPQGAPVLATPSMASF